MTTTLDNPHLVIEAAGDTIKLRFQDPATKADLVIVHLPRSTAAITLDGEALT